MGGYTQSNKNINGEGRFYAKDQDSLRFIKSQLLHSAFSDVLSKELKYLGLDSALFWKNYDEKFNNYFGPIKEQLQKKYLTGENPSLKERKEFNKLHRLKRLGLRAKFGKLDRTVTSYSIKKMSRSPQVPNSRYINVSAQVDRKLLKKVYFQMVSKATSNVINNIYLSAHFEINDLSWSELGVELEQNFTSVIKEHWKKWLKNNLKTHFNDVIMVNADKERELIEFSKAPREATVEPLLEAPPATDEVPLNEFKNGLWLKVNIDLNKVKEELLMKERTYKLTGDFLLTNLNTGEVVDSFDLPTLESKYSFEPNFPLSTSLATWVYRTASSEFNKFDNKIANISVSTKSVNLIIRGTRSYLDFIKIGEMLSIKGASQRFSTKLLSFQGDSGILRLNFSGNKENLLITLAGLGETKLDESRVLSKGEEGNPFSFRIINEGVEVITPKAKSGKIKEKKND